MNNSSFFRLYLIALFTIFFLINGRSQNPFCHFDCSDPEACFTCDINTVDGLFIPASFYTPIGNEDWAFNLAPCQGNNTTSNPIFLYFMAGSPSISYGVIMSNCVASANSSVQIGLTDGCGEECLAGDVLCNPNILNRELTYDELIPGNTYAIWVDGCNGNACDIEIWVDHGPTFEFNDPLAITAYNLCTDSCLSGNCSGNTNCDGLDEIIVCPGDEIEFRVRHQGNSLPDNGDYDDECSYYNPEVNATFSWWAALTFEGENYTSTPADDGHLVITMPEVFIESYGEICLEEVSNECTSTNQEVCMTIIIRPVVEEQFDYQVCAEDLAGGWRVPLRDDPNGDGISWLGEPGFTLEEVESWNFGCLRSSVITSCDCEVIQTMCIEILGSNEKTEKTLYMYDCQFDGSGDYNWYWENTRETIRLDKDEKNECLVIDEESLLMDYDSEACDSTVVITVETYTLEGTMTQIDCSDGANEKWGLYKFEFDLSFLEDEDFENWPRIDSDYRIKSLFNSAGESFEPTDLQTFHYETSSSDVFYVSVEYNFQNGVWADGPFQEKTSCEKSFGPFQLTAGCELTEVTTCPDWSAGYRYFLDGQEIPETGYELFFEEPYFLSIGLSEDLLPNNSHIDWYLMDEADDIPGQDGELLGSSKISSNWTYGEQYPELLAISYRDYANQSEYFVVGTGSGLYVDDLIIKLDANCDSSCPADCAEELWGSQCEWNLSTKEVLKDCANIIAVGPGDYVPPNSILVVYVDEDKEELVRSAEYLCGIDGCIYVLFNECERCLDGFADEGMASYTIFGSSYESSLSYLAEPDGGAVNKQGEYTYERDSLPMVDAVPYLISAQVEPVGFDIHCLRHSGRHYVQGIIVSETFNTACCSPYTPKLTLNVDCSQITWEFFWRDISKLPTDLTYKNVDCEKPFQVGNQFSFTGGYEFPPPKNAYVSDCPGDVTFSSSHQPWSYFPEGVTTVIYTVSDECGNKITHEFTVTVECEVIGGGADNEVFKDFPFLSTLINTSDCDGTTVSVYTQGSYSYIHVETATEAILYFQDGTKYCTDSANFSCVTAYGFGPAAQVWECESGGGTGNPDLSILDDYPWMSTIIDFDDCSEVEIEFYAFGSQIFPYVITPNSAILYSNTGQIYCSSNLPAYDCIALYGLDSPIGFWGCDTTGPPPPPVRDPIFDDNPWLEDLVHLADCMGDKITVYQQGSYKYFFVETAGITTMYNASGLQYCQDFPNFSCADAYGFSADDIIETWECNGRRKIKERERSSKIYDDIQAYPNPTSGLVYLNTTMPYEDLEIAVYDLTGRELTMGYDKQNGYVDLSQETPGVYLLRIQYDGKRIVKRVMLSQY